MINKTFRCLAVALAFACACGASAVAQTLAPSTFKHITIDGSFDDWTGVPVAYTAPVGNASAIEYENIYVANDESNLYIRFTLYTPRPNAFANSYDNIFIDTDTNAATGYAVGGIGSEMLVQWGGGYQETNAEFTSGSIDNLGWNIAGSPDSTDFELSISLGATYPDNAAVFASNTIAILMEGDNSGYANTEFAPSTGGLVYTFAPTPAAVATNTPVISLANSSWEVNASGTDLGTDWLSQAYDDTVSGWTTGDGLFGYTPYSSAYPSIQTPLSSGPNTYYFRTHFQWTNDTANIAFVVTNYLSDGAVYYLNGTEVESLRMPSGTIAYATAATATNSPVGATDIFGINGAVLESGDNIMEVETHQAPNSSADMVFGLSLTAASHYTISIVNTNLPASQVVLAGQSVTFTSDIIGSGPLSYQWFFDGTNAIAGANGPAYTIPLVLTNDAGSYSLQVSNSFSSVTTASALLTVSNVPVSITAQPVDEAAMVGQPATFEVSVSGTPPIQYQWSFDGTAIAGATNNAYTIASSDATNDGVYQVMITNPLLTTNSSVVSLTVLSNTIPPILTAISASVSNIIVTFSEPLDQVSASIANNYSISGGVTVLSAVQNPANASQVTLTTGVPMNFGTVYTLGVNGVKDLYGNSAHISGQFTRDITIDGSFDDWTGIAPLYTSSAPTGISDAADVEAIYMCDDANYYYFRVTLWTDIDPASGQFPSYVTMYYDTDNNPNTGYTAIGSDLMVQSGSSYQEKDGTFNDNFPINNLNWLCLPASPGTNFEFRMSKAATFSEDESVVFPTNTIDYLWQSATPTYALANTVPAGGGVISYTNATPVAVAPLPPGNLAIITLRGGGQAAIVWTPGATLQVSPSLTGSSWTSLTSATSPYIIPLSGTNEFYRLMH
jgi:Bacterial Ig-like domain/Immunoglobulin I-set domain